MSRPPGRLTIGAVLERLKVDFPDVSISKIRFLEAEGLVHPQRTAAGYRTFDEGDVERLAYILTAQRERFWPLKVIREALEAMDRGLQAPDPSGDRPIVPHLPVDDDLPTPADLGPSPSDLRLTRQEIARSADLDDATVDALISYGLLKPGSDGHFPAAALPVAHACAALASYGLEPRHLRPFRTAADRELGLLEQVLSPTRGRGTGEAEHAKAELLRHCIALHTALVKAALSAS